MRTCSRPSILTLTPATRILCGSIVVVLAIVLATTWGATQRTAWLLAFQSELGPAWFRLGSLPVYPPPAFFWWRYRFDAYAPQVFIEGAGLAASGGFAPARVSAPSRPALLTWPGSAIVHDIKGENWTLTAGWRARFGCVLLFDPTNPQSSAYNPLLEVRRGPAEGRDVQNVADILVDPEGALERRNHWERTSHSLLVGAILHVLYSEADKTLAGVANVLSDPRRPIETTLKAMMTTKHLGAAGPHPVVASTARELLNKSENERSGVLSTAMSFLGLYRDPVVAQVTRRCDWFIDDLVSAEKPATLYLVVPPSDISRTKPLVRLLLNQIGRRLTEELDAKSRRHRLLLMRDEFLALGRLDFFQSALAFMVGYGLKSFLIAQSLNQIEKAYGPNNAILDNCHVRVSFATNDERTAKRVSDALGTALPMHRDKLQPPSEKVPSSRPRFVQSERHQRDQAFAVGPPLNGENHRGFQR